MGCDDDHLGRVQCAGRVAPLQGLVAGSGLAAARVGLLVVDARPIRPVLVSAIRGLERSRDGMAALDDKLPKVGAHPPEGP